MNDLTPRYVEFATAIKKGDNEFEYNKAVKANENFTNQNFNALFDEILLLRAQIAELEGRLP